MILTRRMLISAAVAGIILAGGAAVAATASADRLEQARRDDLKAKTATSQPATTPGAITVSPEPSPEPSHLPDDVVSHLVTVDPNEIAEYWTPERLQHAQPMPIPEATLIEPTN